VRGSFGFTIAQEGLFSEKNISVRKFSLFCELKGTAMHLKDGLVPTFSFEV
jgi:hypothetical protein